MKRDGTALLALVLSVAGMVGAERFLSEKEEVIVLVITVVVLLPVTVFSRISRRKSKEVTSPPSATAVSSLPALFLVGIAIAVASVTMMQGRTMVRIACGVIALLALLAGKALLDTVLAAARRLREQKPDSDAPPAQGPFRTGAPPDDDPASNHSSTPRTPTR